MLNQVFACWQSEAKQLEMILSRWRETQGDTEDLAVLRKSLKELHPEGKFSFLLRGRKQKIIFMWISYPDGYLRLQIGLEQNQVNTGRVDESHDQPTSNASNEVSSGAAASPCLYLLSSRITLEYIYRTKKDFQEYFVSL